MGLRFGNQGSFDVDVDMGERDVGDQVVDVGGDVNLVDSVLEGGMQVDGDLGETTLQLSGQSISGSEVQSASVVSFTDGLPQGEPSHQRQ